ncbi:unnamed protein product [Phytomonas sp. EM1]|nr:unnamed protein product [Phytomonas sp. EM1]|eukprot:CCW65391.1 unnamed protein product [Phytomonas sp. isolate EM1]
MACFRSRDEQLSFSEAIHHSYGDDDVVDHFGSDFQARAIFCRFHAGISADGLTLILPTHSNHSVFQSPCEVVFTPHPFLFTPHRREPPQSPCGGATRVRDGAEVSFLLKKPTDNRFIVAVEEADAGGPHCHYSPCTSSSIPSICAAEEHTVQRPITVRCTTASTTLKQMREDAQANTAVEICYASPGSTLAAHGKGVGSCPTCWSLTMDDYTVDPTSYSITIAYIQIRDNLLFAIKPTGVLPMGATGGGVGGGNHSKGLDAVDLSVAASTDELDAYHATAGSTTATTSSVLPQAIENITTAAVMRRRWFFAHPSANLEPPSVASWTQLCSCAVLPLYGVKSVYPRDAFYTVSPHQYTVDHGRGGNRGDVLEFILQRLQQQYQIVLESGQQAGAPLQCCIPHTSLLPNTGFELSVGHQTHTLKVGETASSLSVSRMLHRGMYRNGQVSRVLSYRYALWNYLDDRFDQREAHMGIQIGEKNDYGWEVLDLWVQARLRGPIPRSLDIWLRPREIAVALVPENPAKPPSFEEFLQLITYRASVHLRPRNGMEWRLDTTPLSVEVPSSSSPPLPMETVVLVQDHTHTLDTRSIVDASTGRTVVLEKAINDRTMGVDVILSPNYNPNCMYLLKLTWLACAGSIVLDWYCSFVANAMRHRFRGVPLPCYYHNPKKELLTVHTSVRAGATEEESLLRHLFLLLTQPKYRYYPDTPVMGRCCRLLHASGLCYVVAPPGGGAVMEWYQNACVQQGSPLQRELHQQFLEAVETARGEVRRTSGLVQGGGER